MRAEDPPGCPCKHHGIKHSDSPRFITLLIFRCITVLLVLDWVWCLSHEDMGRSYQDNGMDCIHIPWFVYAIICGLHDASLAYGVWTAIEMA